MSLGMMESRQGSESGDSCVKCGSPGDKADSVCRNCGYYAQLNTFVEIDEMDRYYKDGDYDVPDQNDPNESEYVRAFKAVPTWAWQMLGILGLVTVLCFLFHVVAPANSAIRLLGAVGMVVFGLMAGFAAHVVVGVKVVQEEFELNGMDILICPFRIWRHVLMRLPKLFRPSAIGVGGVWAVLMAHVIIGVPYWQMMSGGEPPKKKKKPVNPVVSGMASAAQSDEMTMEEAMKQLGGASSKKKEEEEEPALTLQDAIRQVWRDAFEDTEPGVVSDADADKLNETRRVKLRALTVGVKQDEEGNIMSLIVAVKNEGKWQVAGAVSRGLTDEAAAKLKEKIALIRRDEPFVPCKLKATWIEPVIYCSVEADYTPNEETFEKISLKGLD